MPSDCLVLSTSVHSRWSRTGRNAMALSSLNLCTALPPATVWPAPPATPPPPPLSQHSRRLWQTAHRFLSTRSLALSSPPPAAVSAMDTSLVTLASALRRSRASRITSSAEARGSGASSSMSSSSSSSSSTGARLAISLLSRARMPRYWAYSSSLRISGK